MKICFNNLFGDGIGWNFGVSTWIRNTKSSLDKLGIKHSPTAKIALSMGLPRAFNPIPDRFNIFMTLFETEDLFSEDYEKMSKANAIIVPCQHNKEVLERHIKDIPILIATGGFDEKTFTYRQRNYNKNLPFYFLYVGSMNPRKGYDIAIKSFIEHRKNNNNNNQFLYIKTTEEGKNELYEPDSNNIIYDYRVLSTKELNELYHKCHCMLLPTHGEGIGLTPMEAAATGMPVIHTPYGGTKEFLNDKNSLLLNYSMINTELYYPTENNGRKSIDTKWAEPDFNNLLYWMKFMSVSENYNSIILSQKQGLSLMRQGMKWSTYAKVLKVYIKSFEKESRKYTPKVILNLGCGNRQFPSTIGVDNRKEVKPDIVFDLSKVPYRFAKKNSVDEILCFNMLEHFVDVIPVMKEYYRILKLDGMLHIQVPYYKSPNFFTDPTHHHGFTENSMDFFDKSTFHGKINNYANINFKVVYGQLLETGDVYFVLQKKCNDDLGDGKPCTNKCGKGCSCKKER